MPIGPKTGSVTQKKKKALECQSCIQRRKVRGGSRCCESKWGGTKNVKTRSGIKKGGETQASVALPESKVSPKRKTARGITKGGRSTTKRK